MKNINAVQTVFTSLLAPSDSMWWLFAITFPLTLVALILNSRKSQKAFNDLGGIMVCGVPALTLVVIFYGSFVAIGVVVLWKIMRILSLSLNLGITGIWSVFLGLAMLIPIFLVLCLLEMIGAVKFVPELHDYVKGLVGRIWTKRTTIYKNPHLVWAILGASLLALFINSAFVTNLTSAFLPGLIPGIVAALGVFVLVRRTVLVGRHRNQ